MFVRCSGVKGDYVSLAGELASRSFAGDNVAAKLLQWAQGPVALNSLDNDLATLAVILYFAEVGRGYIYEIGQFESWLRETGQSQTSREGFQSWQKFPWRYTFATTAAEDQGPNGLYVP